MDSPDYLFSAVFVRDCVVRERGIDILVPFSKARRLVTSLKKLGGEVDYGKQDRVARYVILIGGWLPNISCEYLFPPDIDVNILCVAAECGHLEALQWLRKEGCPWNANVCSYSAERGHLKVLQWARENGCPWDNYTISTVRWDDHHRVVEWALANGCPEE